MVNEVNNNYKKVHNIKLYEDFADDVLNGRKNFEIRENDRGYQTGDKVKFTVIQHNGISCYHKLKDRTFEITYVLSGWGLKDGYVVFGIKDITEDEDVTEKINNIKNKYFEVMADYIKTDGEIPELFYCYDCPHYDIVLDYCSMLDDYACVESCPLSKNNKGNYEMVDKSFYTFGDTFCDLFENK